MPDLTLWTTVPDSRQLRAAPRVSCSLQSFSATPSFVEFVRLVHKIQKAQHMLYILVVFIVIYHLVVADHVE